MAEKKELKQSTGVGFVQGILKEKNLKIDEERVKKNNPKIKGAIVKNENSNPAVTLEVNGNIVELDIFPTYRDYESDGKIVANSSFTTLKNLMETPIGTRIAFKVSLNENGYAGKDKSTNEIKFYSSPKLMINAIHSTLVEEDCADIKVSGIIGNIKDEIDSNEMPTGRKIIDFYCLKNNTEAGMLLTPFKFIANPDMAEIDGYYSKGDSCFIDVEVTSRTVGAKATETEGRLGNRKSNVKGGYTVQEFCVFGGDPALDEENAYYIPIEEIKGLREARKVYESALIEKKKSEESSSASNSKSGGLGNRATNATVDVTADADIDDPFA